ncbi:hypothetical protein AB0D14_27025 [Streptomyces sp. NPDC048484]|uniref:hypothetical protein n=1 Tax=Streptomyces sp. NPDC048484 TaxID=3155146 RepID=UPI00342134DA
MRSHTRIGGLVGSGRRADVCALEVEETGEGAAEETAGEPGGEHGAEAGAWVLRRYRNGCAHS